MEKSEGQFRELLERYLNGTATPAEREILEQFFESYQADTVGQETIGDEALVRDRLLRKIHERVDSAKKSRRVIRAFWLPLAAAIAIFCVTIFFTYLRQSPSDSVKQQVELIRHSTGPGERIVKVLPDGTTAYLNNRTTLSYPESFGPVREVSVEGEVFFEVIANGKPFIASCGEVKTQVLGTSFNVKHRVGSATEITLVEGAVNVISSNGTSLGLKPSEQAVIDGTMKKSTVNVMRYAGWKDNILFFEQTTFEEAIREIEDWYAVDIDIANPLLKQCAITAKYQDEPLGNVLSSLEFLLGLSIKRLNDTHFLLDGEGCK